MDIDYIEIDDNGFEGSAKAAVEATNARRVALAETADEAEALIRKEPDIVKRASRLFAAQLINFPDVKKVRSGDMFVTQPLPTDQNRKCIMDAMFGGEDDQPRHDLFRGRVVDHRGEIIDDRYPVLDWVEAFAAGGLKGVSAKQARDFLREWAFHNKQNDLIRYVERKIPDWDGKPRMATKLIEIFECDDTKLNRDFGQYFWLSLYSRVMMPGSLAPIVLSLFGAQGCGKSRFTKQLSKIITGNEEADSVQLNLDSERIPFLRSITGHSVIAAVGEMTGFNRGDLNKIKDFITRDSDQMDYKFEGTFTQQRQWITIMDGNKYEGLQRDETGNRRFYPMFCGQLSDKLGKPDWRADFVVAESVWSTLEDEVWQIMAEAALWFDDNGENGYAQFVGDVIRAVREFSTAEMNRDSGTIQDDVFDVYLVPMLKEGPKFMWTRQVGDRCVGVKTGEFKRYFMDTLRHVKPNWKHLKHKMASLGAFEHAFSGGYAGFLFPGYVSLDDFKAKLGARDYDDGGSVSDSVEGTRADGGF